MVWALLGGRGAVCLAPSPEGTCPPWALGPPCGLVKQDSSLQVLLLEPELFHDGQLFLVPLGLPFQIQNEVPKPTTPTVHDKQAPTAPESPRAASRVQWEGQHHPGLKVLTELGLGLYTALFPNAQKERKVEEKESSGIGGAPQAAPKPSALEPKDTDSGEEESSPTAAREPRTQRKTAQNMRVKRLDTQPGCVSSDCYPGNSFTELCATGRASPGYWAASPQDWLLTVISQTAAPPQCTGHSTKH